jgi:uncharacterized protein (DUF1778 family)
MAAVLRQRIDDTASQQSLTAHCISATMTTDTRILNENTSTSDPLEINRDIHVSDRDFKLFLVTLQSDEGPNDALRQAADQYKQKYG